MGVGKYSKSSQDKPSGMFGQMMQGGPPAFNPGKTVKKGNKKFAQVQKGRKKSSKRGSKVSGY